MEQMLDRHRGRQTVCYHPGPPPLLPVSRHADHALRQDTNGSPGRPGQGSAHGQSNSSADAAKQERLMRLQMVSHITNLLSFICHLAKRDLA